MLASIEEGRAYEFIGVPSDHGLLPKGCAGQLYRAVRFVKDVPSYQRKVLVEALTGPDAGDWFTVSEHNFKIRYKLPEEDEAEPEPLPEKVAGRNEQGSGA